MSLTITDFIPLAVNKVPAPFITQKILFTLANQAEIVQVVISFMPYIKAKSAFSALISLLILNKDNNSLIGFILLYQC